MSRPPSSQRLSVAEALRHVPGPAGERWATVFRHGTLDVEIYAPKDHDPQQPHDRDEVYIVVSGNGVFVHGDQIDVVGPGDFLFAAAGVEHRFEKFSADLVVWVLFYGPTGGEAAA